LQDRPCPTFKALQASIGVELARKRVVALEDFARLIENPRSQSPLEPTRVTAQPSGLFLESVDY
jgi:hypothetical protein